MRQLYDTIGRGYRNVRQPDPRIAEALRRALGDARSVLNVGAGSASYEPTDRTVVAVEPSTTMIRQRGPAAAPVIQASAEALPLVDQCVDAALAILTVHHWPDQAAGLAELRRVARDRVVLLTWDPQAPGFWLTEYFGDILDLDREIFPRLALLTEALGRLDVRPIPIPHDCTDGFMGAYWRRPARYLEEEVRAAISTFSRIQRVEERLDRLRGDLEDGTWEREFGDVMERSELDLGYRVVVSEC